MPRVGESARVIARIAPNVLGEVTMSSPKGGTESLPARASDPAQVYEAGEQVYVVDESGRCVYVSKGE